MADRVPRCAVCSGVVKPDIVFFGEELPQRFLLHLADFPLADLLFVIGTSLEVWEQQQKAPQKQGPKGSRGERGAGGGGWVIKVKF